MHVKVGPVSGPENNVSVSVLIIEGRRGCPDFSRNVLFSYACNGRWRSSLRFAVISCVWCCHLDSPCQHLRVQDCQTKEINGRSVLTRGPWVVAKCGSVKGTL